jgi:glucose/arabinose dehydrogenase
MPLRSTFANTAGAVLCAAVLLAACSTTSRPAKGSLAKIKLPPGFEISVYTDAVPNARTLALSPNGTLFVGTYKEGKVYAVVPSAAGGTPRVVTVAEGMNNPNGVAFRDGALYVVEPTCIYRFDAIEQQLAAPPKPTKIYEGFPQQKIHGLRTIRFGPDGMAYVPVGSSCNVCKANPDRYAVLLRLNLADAQPKPEIFGRGIRDTQGYDWHPQTGELWFVENGRDGLGNDAPPDELNRAPKAGLDFGFPFCHGTNVADPKFGAERACADSTAPALDLPAHSAPLSARFYTGRQFPAQYRNRIFIAEHGSSDREPKIGHRIGMVTLEDNRVVKYEPFAEGWLQDNVAWGRPVDLIVAPDGALLVSDDKAGAIYRISYRAR